MYILGRRVSGSAPPGGGGKEREREREREREARIFCYQRKSLSLSHARLSPQTRVDSHGLKS